jgi:hypothetical protein
MKRLIIEEGIGRLRIRLFMFLSRLQRDGAPSRMYMLLLSAIPYAGIHERRYTHLASQLQRVDQRSGRNQ